MSGMVNTWFTNVSDPFKETHDPMVGHCRHFLCLIQYSCISEVVVSPCLMALVTASPSLLGLYSSHTKPPPSMSLYLIDPVSTAASPYNLLPFKWKSSSSLEVPCPLPHVLSFRPNFCRFHFSSVVLYVLRLPLTSAMGWSETDQKFHDVN